MVKKDVVEKYRVKYEDNSYIQAMIDNAARYFSKDRQKVNREKFGHSRPSEDKDPTWQFIPHDFMHTLMQILAARECMKRDINAGIRGNKDTVNFMDAGCGIGNIMLLASAVGIQGMYGYTRVHGIELDKQGAGIAQVLTGAELTPKGATWKKYNTVFNADIITHRFYNRYDVVYYYCPIKFYPLQILFEEILEDSIRPGTVIIANLKRSKIVQKDYRFENIPVILEDYSRTNLIRKLKTGPRKKTNLTEEMLAKIPEQYQKIAQKHVKGLKLRLNYY